MSEYRSKCLLILIILLATIGTYTVLRTSTLHPSLVLVSCFLLILLLGGLIWGVISPLSALVGVVLVGIWMRVLIQLVASGVIGVDTVWYSEQVHAVASSGTTEAIDSNFYSSASAFVVLLTNIAIVNRLTAGGAIMIFSVYLGLAFPLLSAIVARRITPVTGNISACITAAIITVGTTAMFFSYVPVAQSFTMVLVVLLFWVLSSENE